MSALDLEVPADSTEEPDAPAKDGLIAMIDMYLRYSKQTKHGASPPTHRITSEEVISLPPLPTHSRTPMQVTDAPLFDNWQRSDPTTTPGSDNWQPFDRGTYNPDTGTWSTIGSTFRTNNEKGTANITIVSASGFPSSANVRVHVLVQGAKGAKRAHKTKAHKASGDSPISYNESFRIPGTTADASYQIRVVDHSAFRSDDTLGVAMFFVSDQGSVADQDKPVPVGEGTVTIRSSFNAPEGSLRPTSLHSTNSDAV
ncbi:uncharacterized protein PFLUO_LOCUS2935 [Penicillium psychrofluorescens]|uniref:uncharacterized protein n=1 Tax=Penicillium psychrofluorescens TaxID=3158075 RepID=UPI003CCE1D1E